MNTDKKRVQKLAATAKTLRGDKGYLRTSLGKKLLKEAVALRLRWPEVVKIFGRAQGTVEKACSFHGVRRPNYHISWPDEAIEVVEEYAEKIPQSKNQRELTACFREMYLAVNKVLKASGFPSKSMTAINCFFRGSKFYKGPYELEYITWSRQAEKVLGQFYKKSFKLKTKPESDALRVKMLRALNAIFAKEGLPSKNLGAVRQHALTEGLRWGWYRGKYPSVKAEKKLERDKRRESEVKKLMEAPNDPGFWQP